MREYHHHIALAKYCSEVSGQLIIRFIP